MVAHARPTRLGTSTCMAAWVDLVELSFMQQTWGLPEYVRSTDTRRHGRIVFYSVGTEYIPKVSVLTR